MKPEFLLGIAVAVLFGGIGAYVGLQSGAGDALPAAASQSAASTDPVAQFFAQSLPTAAGQPQPLSAWRGKTMLVNFWATWCPPCVEEMPELAALQSGQEFKNLQVIGIGIDSPDNIKQFLAKHKIGYPNYVAGMEGTELSKALGNAKSGLPYTVLIGADGKIRKSYSGRLKMDEVKSDLRGL